MKVGATHVLDPNVEGDRLIERVRASDGRTDESRVERRPRLGRTTERRRRRSRRRSGRARNSFGRSSKPGPDPTGILPMQQAYQMASAGGHVITTGLVRGTIALPAFLFAIGGITHSRRPGRRRQPDARHPALRRDARQRALRRQGARHARRRRCRTCSTPTKKSRIARPSRRIMTGQ